MLLGTALAGAAAFTACSGESGPTPIVANATETTAETADSFPPTTPPEAGPDIPTEDQLASQGYFLVNDTSLGNVWIGLHEAADEEFAQLQYVVGARANQILLSLESVPVRVDGVVYDTSFSIPSSEVVRSYLVVPDSSHPDYALLHQGYTKTAPDGQQQLVGTSGVIGQQPDGMGPIFNPTVELCQGLELTIHPSGQGETDLAVSDTLYGQAKAGVCEGLGWATDRAFFDYPYSEYVAEFRGQSIDDIPSLGAVVEYPIFDEATYNDLIVQN